MTDNVKFKEFLKKKLKETLGEPHIFRLSTWFSNKKQWFLELDNKNTLWLNSVWLESMCEDYSLNYKDMTSIIWEVADELLEKKGSFSMIIRWRGEQKYRWKNSQ